MNTNLPGKLLKRKLAELNSALFFAEGDSLFKLPNHLVTEMEINDDGEIRFVIPKPAQDIEAFDKEFPVRLEFFKKGIFKSTATVTENYLTRCDIIVFDAIIRNS